jgi:hypothetical protein
LGEIEFETRPPPQNFSLYKTQNKPFSISEKKLQRRDTQATMSET